MKQLILAEQLKLKRTFAKKAFFLVPVAVLALAFFLTRGMYNSFPAGAWNWWYTLFLPGMLSVACCLMMNKEKKKKYHTIFSVCISPKLVWKSKIVLCSILLLVSNLILCVGAMLGGKIFGTYITITANILASVVLTLTYLWEIPLFLFLSAKFGMFVCVFTSVVLAVMGTAFFAPSKLWWVITSAIPVRMMSPILTILPNGLPVPEGHAFMNYKILIPGILITLVVFGMLTGWTANWFAKREER